MSFSAVKIGLGSDLTAASWFFLACCCSALSSCECCCCGASTRDPSLYRQPASVSFSSFRPTAKRARFFSFFFFTPDSPLMAWDSASIACTAAAVAAAVATASAEPLQRMAIDSAAAATFSARSCSVASGAKCPVLPQLSDTLPAPPLPAPPLPAPPLPAPPLPAPPPP